MMTTRFRLAGLLLKWAVFDRRKDPIPVSRLQMRCLPTELDMNLHMNNARYLSLMDLGRFHLILVTGLWRTVRQRRWAPVIASAEIAFKRSIRPGERFTLETQVVRVGTTSVQIRQRFLVGDRLAAEGHVTAVFLHNGKPQPLADYAGAVPGLTVAPADEPTMPPIPLQTPPARP